MIQIGQVVHYVTPDGGEYDALVTAVFSAEQSGTVEPVVNLALVDLATKQPGLHDRVIRPIKHVLHESAPTVARDLAGNSVSCWRHAQVTPLDIAELPELPGFDPAQLGEVPRLHRRGVMTRIATSLCDWIHADNLCGHEHIPRKPLEGDPAGSFAGPLGSVDDPDGDRAINWPGMTDDSTPEALPADTHKDDSAS